MAAPNLFNLEGEDLTISYSASGLDGRPHLTYEDADVDLTFGGDDVTEVESPLGTLVTVRLRRIPDHSVTTFTLVVPAVVVGEDEDHHAVETLGFTTERRTSIAPATLRGQLQSSVTSTLKGSARAIDF